MGGNPSITLLSKNSSCMRAIFENFRVNPAPNIYHFISPPETVSSIPRRFQLRFLTAISYIDFLLLFADFFYHVLLISALIFLCDRDANEARFVLVPERPVPCSVWQ